jgi:hypothetical protein
VTAVFNIGVPLLAGATLLIAILFFVKALATRARQTGPLVYGVGRLELHRSTRVDLLRSLGLLIVALTLFGVYGLGPLLADLEQDVALPSPVVTPTVVTPMATMPLVEAPTHTPLPPVSPTQPVRPSAEPSAEPPAEPSPTSPLPTPTATAEPTETPTPEPPSAVVNSPNGLWLRDAPRASGGAIENLRHETVLLLLPGRETVDDLEWQQVRAPSGNEGWVAAQFLVYR